MVWRQNRARWSGGATRRRGQAEILSGGGALRWSSCGATTARRRSPAGFTAAERSCLRRRWDSSSLGYGCFPAAATVRSGEDLWRAFLPRGGRAAARRDSIGGLAWRCAGQQAGLAHVANATAAAVGGRATTRTWQGKSEGAVHVRARAVRRDHGEARQGGGVVRPRGGTAVRRR